MSRPVLIALALVACGPKQAPEPASDAPADTFPPRPEPGPPQAWTPPTPVRTELSSGVPVYTVTDASLPLASLHLTVPTGSASDPDERAGRAALGASMLGEGAGERSTLEQAAALEALAADLSFGLRREATTLSLDVHADRLEQALPLAADALLRPRFDETEWARVKQQHLTLLAASLDDNRTVASQVGRLRWWGADHPYGSPTDGTPDSAGAVTLDEVKAWHRTEMHAGGAAFVVVGDVTSERATALLEEHFGAWEARERPAVEVAAARAPSGIVLVDRPGSTQTVFHIVIPGISTGEPRAALDVATTIMGGSFTSRLNRRLREELGYTYGARMAKGSMIHGGTLVVGSNVRGDATADALREVKVLLDAAASEGFTEAEVQRGRAQVLSDVVDSAETRRGLARMLLEPLIGGQPLDRLATRIETVDGITPSAVDAAARRMAWEDALVVLVGDREAIAGPLTEAGFTDVAVVDANGEAVE